MSNISNLAMLCGNEKTVYALKSSLGKMITALEISSGLTSNGNSFSKLILTFTDNAQLKIWDAEQKCCERRYMVTDDNLNDYIGGKLLDIELRDAPATGECREIIFLVIKTSKGEFVISTHNENNGYYCGFSFAAEASIAETACQVI